LIRPPTGVKSGAVFREAYATFDARRRRRRNRASGEARVSPVWPLPKHMDDDEISARFAKFDQWHYAYAFQGGLSFPARHNLARALADDSDRPLKRFRHFMPALLDACGGSLAGKSVLDIACNSGFWSIQCALMGADVVGFNARPELIEEAKLIKEITGVQNAEFRQLDFWDMASLGTFDVVLNLGILYHLPKPLDALELTRAMGKIILLDTAISPSRDPIVRLRWEEPVYVRNAAYAGIVANPSKSALEMMFRHLRLEWDEIPILTPMPDDYLTDRRASWILRPSDKG
jgi:2-polyprenyl-3-methyl-5-hydroxy-6-metoxy-1,4-benzoquinol methylase